MYTVTPLPIDLKPRFSHNTDEKLISAVYKREPLWNPASELHKNSVVLKKLWHSIALELGKDVTSIKTRWKNLRAYFIKVHRKSDCGDQMSTITWQFYDQLSFLKHCSPGLEGIGDRVRVENEDSNSSIGETLEDNTDDKPNSDSDSCASQPPRKKPRNIAPRIELEVERIKEIPEAENYQERNYDDQQFFESLLPYVKNIPLMRKLKLRCKIQEMILKELEAVENDIAQQQARFTEVYVEPVVQNISKPVPELVTVKKEPGGED
ncbi:uncharacterized protein LOC112046857 [Bicyclus anynana]|uniref:Uncharacterized protein LOC112046857 n=1 Tax=Bicyclus anynana TaxID=110368 RepID=A0A6J1N8R8_BICAN|nr:uncharacterized protein LOC112046857 [Bicyclus anynana]